MNNRKYPILVIIFAFISTFVILSCGGNAFSPTKTIIPSPVNTMVINQAASNSPGPTVSFLPSPTWAPTLSQNNETYLSKLLHDENCVLPCYLGIIPGKTSLKSAMKILKNLGVDNYTKYVRNTDEAIYYGFSLPIGYIDDSNKIKQNPDSPVLVYHHVNLITNDDIVQIIEVSANSLKSDESKEKFHNLWSNYSLREVFLKLGVPDNLFTSTGDPSIDFFGQTLLIEYKRFGIFIQMDGTKMDNHLCPINDVQYISLGIDLYNPDSDLSIYSDQRVPPTNRSVWLTIDESLGISVRDFYTLITKYPSICFVPIKVSP